MIGVAVVGYGYWGPNLVRNFCDVPGARLVTVCDLDERKLAYALPDALVMHPGPMNRGVEIDSIVADGAQSLIREQVEMGVAVRMACLDLLTAGRRA